MPIIRTLAMMATLLGAVNTHDFTAGMFKRNDLLMAQDRLYKARVPFGFTTATYGRVFKCPITFIRVVDRLGVSRGPTAQIIRGGLLNNLVVLRIRSPYNTPISVSVLIGCENKLLTTQSSRVTKASSVNDGQPTEAGVESATGSKGAPETAAAGGEAEGTTEAGADAVSEIATTGDDTPA